VHTGILCFVLFPDSFAATPTRARTSSLTDKRRMRQVTHFKILLKQTAKQDGTGGKCNTLKKVHIYGTWEKE